VLSRLVVRPRTKISPSSFGNRTPASGFSGVCDDVYVSMADGSIVAAGTESTGNRSKIHGAARSNRSAEPPKLTIIWPPPVTKSDIAFV
jgi:hypothetical protein